MSFEQRKRVSIAVELAANPSILFLDEPTTGLDSRAAQALIRNIQTIAKTGRAIVCTIHQPSTAIFNAFTSLLLLKRGGQTVYFGELGYHSENLVQFFQAAPNVSKMPIYMNPATWMLEVIGAGTSVAAASANSTITDFHIHYNQSALCELNLSRLDHFIRPNEGSKKVQTDSAKYVSNAPAHTQSEQRQYNASTWTQFRLLMHRIALTYWRTPSYSLFRHFTYVIIALIFASAYPNQKYETYVAATSRAAVIYITALFCGILSMLTNFPLMTADRIVFYREQQSQMYSVWIYCVTLFLIEIPYLILSSFSFTLPFFYIVGFDNVGFITQKFFWYWFFIFLLQGTMLFLGQFFIALTPTEATANILGGFNNTISGLFCGFLIQAQNIPTFWLFMYWLNPLHYALEGLITSQFHDDTTMITLANGSVMTSEAYIEEVQFSTWKYSHVGYDVLALCIFVAVSL